MKDGMTKSAIQTITTMSKLKLMPEGHSICGSATLGTQMGAWFMVPQCKCKKVANENCTLSFDWLENDNFRRVESLL